MLRALGSVSGHITHGTGGMICYGHWVLCLVISHTRQGVRLDRALGSASSDITHETRGTICCGQSLLHLVISHTRQWGMICYGHRVLLVVISHTRQGVRFVTGIAFCVL